LGSAAFPGARAAKPTGNQAVATFLLTNTNLDLIGQLQLDDAVYDAQSRHLIPRAVGYSAAVLDYFFRGELEVDDTKTKFQLTGQSQPGEVCAPIPIFEFGSLVVEYEIPSDLAFSGMTSFYYDRQDGTRVLGGQQSNVSSGQPGLGADIIVLHAELPSPVRWYVVLDGQAGPGAQETRGIVAKTGLAEWEFVCLF